MKMRYRLICRGSRGAKFYCVDTLTGRRASLQTPNEDEARQIVLARNQALRQPALNLHIAKAYLAGSDSGVATRTWQHAMDTHVSSKAVHRAYARRAQVKVPSLEEYERRQHPQNVVPLTPSPACAPTEPEPGLVSSPENGSAASMETPLAAG
jgi:hypothetical protein